MENKINQIRLKKNTENYNIINKGRKYNSPNILNKKFIKCFYLSEHIFKPEKINHSIKKEKSFTKRSIISKSQKNKTRNLNKYTNQISKKITFQSNNKNKIKEKEKRLTTLYMNRNNLIMNSDTFKETNRIKKNYIKKIDLNERNHKRQINKGLMTNRYKKLSIHYQPKKICFSLDNILSKEKINKTKIRIKPNSFDNKNKNILINSNPRIKLTYMENKLNSEKIKRNKRFIRNKIGPIKQKNTTTKIILNNRNKKDENKDYYKFERKTVNVFHSFLKDNKSTKNVRENTNTNNNSKILSENISTNYKSLNSKSNLNSTKKEKQKINNNSKYKHKKVISCKNTKRERTNNKLFQFIIENENNERINGVRINNFDVNKPNEVNLKYTFAKEEKEDLSVSRASKVIIGKIDGYKDIIETDKKNNHFKYNTNLYNKTLNKLNLVNTFKNKNIEINKKIIKKEIDSITFNEDEFSLNFNLSNNLDGLSSTNTNNIKNNFTGKNNHEYNNDSNYLKINKKIVNRKKNISNISFSINSEKSITDFSKIVNYNIIKTETKKEKEEKKNSDNCYII